MEHPTDRELSALLHNPHLLPTVGDAHYKRLKEGIVSGREGTSFVELLLLSLLVPAAFVLRTAVTGCLMNAKALRPATPVGGAARVTLNDALLFAVDWVCLCALPLFAFALRAPEHVACLALALVCAIGVVTAVNGLLRQPPLWVLGGQPSGATDSGDDERVQALNGKVQVFVSEFRTSIMVMTVIAILSVDFPVLFPRRHVKAEHFGISLMDIGVGSFIFSHALTSPQARRGTGGSGSGTGSSGGGSGGVGRALLHVIRSVWPMLALGFARLAAVKSTDYHEHVSEYGVHWNFFFTLAAVALLSAAAAPVLPARLYGWAGVAIAVGYQVALSAGGLEQWIVSADRTTGLIAANKEGLTSAIGYFALYLIAVRIGQELSPAAAADTSAIDDAAAMAGLSAGHPLRRWWAVVWRLLQCAVVFAACGALSNIVVQPASRKMINLTYVLCVMALNLVLLCVYLTAALTFARPMRWAGATTGAANGGGGVLSAGVNFNSLAVFLIANLSTGAINLSLRTLFAPVPVAAAVMCAYLAAVTGVAFALYRLRLRLKFW